MNCEVRLATLQPGSLTSNPRWRMKVSVAERLTVDKSGTEVLNDAVPMISLVKVLEEEEKTHTATNNLGICHLDKSEKSSKSKKSGTEAPNEAVPVTMLVKHVWVKLTMMMML